MPSRAKTRTYTAAYKARILAEYESLDKAGKGALLRREGLYTSLRRMVSWSTRGNVGPSAQAGGRVRQLAGIDGRPGEDVLSWIDDHSRYALSVTAHLASWNRRRSVRAAVSVSSSSDEAAPVRTASHRTRIYPTGIIDAWLCPLPARPPSERRP